MKLALSPVISACAAVALLACSAPASDPSARSSVLAPATPGLALGALDAGPRTIPYSGYVDFDGAPVNAGAVALNFAIFSCATPGTADGGCADVWIAKGAWTPAADWKNGWPTGAADKVDLPIFSGRFSVELGASGQNPMPDWVFAAGAEPLYLGVRIQGRALGALQKLVPNPRSHTAERALTADLALTADTVGDLTPDDLLGRGVWVISDDVAAGAALTVQTHGDASDAEVLVWEQRGTTWTALDTDAGFLDDPSLAAYYPFEDAPGSVAADQSGHGRNLALERVYALEQPGRIGKSLKLGGAGAAGGGSATNSALGLTLTSAGLTFSMWLKPTENNRDIHYLTIDRVGTSHDLLLSFYPPDCGPKRLSFRALGCGGITPLNAWTHLVVVVTPGGDDIRHYLDGVAQGAWPWDSSHLLATINYLRFGARYSGASYDYIGFVDELAVFSRALGPDEVRDLYRFGVRPQVTVARASDGAVTVTNQSSDARRLRVMVVK